MKCDHKQHIQVFIGVHVCQKCLHPVKARTDKVYATTRYHDIFADAPKIIRKGLA